MQNVTKFAQNIFTILIYRTVGSLFGAVEEEQAKNRNINRATEIFRVFPGTFDLHKMSQFRGDSFTWRVLGTPFGMLCKLSVALKGVGVAGSRVPCPRLHWGPSVIYIKY